MIKKRCRSTRTCRVGRRRYGLKSIRPDAEDVHTTFPVDDSKTRKEEYLRALALVDKQIPDLVRGPASNGHLGD
jgi:hypothetical protein